MSQTKLGSWVEVTTNVAIGFSVALTTQLAVFPLFGIHIPIEDNLQISTLFTAVSILRSYIVRRVFNRLRIFQRT
jgi:hypothetical protein